MAELQKKGIPPASPPRPAALPASKTIGPIDMAKALIEALGLQGVPGIVKLQITVQAGQLPTLTVVRSITVEQAGGAVARLREWNLRLEPTGLAVDRRVNADGSVGAPEAPLFPSLHPREG